MGATTPQLTTGMDSDGDLTSIAVTATIEIDADLAFSAVVDFSERRETVFPAVSMKRTTVHELGATNADVTEGTRSGPFVFWERCTYDWSQPGRVVATVTDSNVYAVPGSAWEFAAEPCGASTRVTMTWRRRFVRRPVGRFMGFVYRHAGRRVFTNYAGEVLTNLNALAAAERLS